MAKEFRLPDIGEGLAEAEIVSWLVAVGDEVQRDQNIVEVETDKAVVEIPCPFAGTVLHLGGAEGDVVPVGEILIVIGEASETWPPDAEPDASPPLERPSQDQSRAEEVAPIVGSIDGAVHDLDSASGGRQSAGTNRVRALPVVRKLARDHGIDLDTVTATGPDGRITRDDVQRLIEGGPEVVPAAEPSPVPSSESAPAHQDDRSDSVEEPAERADTGGEMSDPSPTTGGRQPLSKLRRTIAANMSRSWAEIPHVTTFDDVDARRLLAVKRALSERAGAPVSLDALVGAAVIPALRQFPEFNGRLDGDDLIVPDHVALGVAVDTPEGLMVVVVSEADRLGIHDLNDSIQRLATGARDRTLGRNELTGQSFTISNIGAVGGGHGTPIVPHGTTAILSFGRAKDRAIVEDGVVIAAPVMPLSLSYDHRVIDGGVGRRFMAMVLENLQEPALFLA